MMNAVWGVVWAIETSHLHQVLSRIRAIFIARDELHHSCVGVLFAVRASPCSPLPPLPGAASAVLSARLTGRVPLVIFFNGFRLSSQARHIYYWQSRCGRTTLKPTSIYRMPCSGVSGLFLSRRWTFSVDFSAIIVPAGLVSTKTGIRVRSCRVHMHVCGLFFGAFINKYYRHLFVMQKSLRYFTSCTRISPVILVPKT